jgi:hypothetical protein
MDLTGLGSVADFATSMADRFFPKKMDETEKAGKTLEFIKALEGREASREANQKEVIVAELNQGDLFTKRARPSIIYFGLAVIGLNHVILPWAAWMIVNIFSKTVELPIIELPAEFWYTWGGVCSVYVWGRTKEKSGAKDKLIGMITGNK